jgi:O-antigen/teichoic acid export membrane protein
MDDVRLRFAGTVGFLVKMLSLATGLIFTVIITRNLSIDEFGQWNVINSLVVYGVFIPAILPYWFTRYTARNTPIARTGIFIMILLAVIGQGIFLVVAKIFIVDFEILYPILVVASIHVVTVSIISALSSITNGKRPELTSYGLLVFEIVKVVIAITYAFSLNISLLDAIIIVLISEIIHLIVLCFFLRKELRKKVEIKNIKKILKTSWIPLYLKMGSLFEFTDVLIVTAITMSYVNIAFFKAGFLFAVIVGMGIQLAFPLYIKMLKGGKVDDIEISTKLMLTFTFPLAFGIFFLAKPLLFLLNPEYVSSAIILQILVFYFFSEAIYGLLTSIVWGKDKVDLLSNPTIKQLIGSSFFKVATANAVRLVSYIGILSSFVLLTIDNSLPIETFGTIWAMILLITNLPKVAYLMKLTRNVTSFKIPWKNIGKYVIASIVMSISVISITSVIEYNPSAIEFAPSLILIVLISAGVYFVVLICIDKDMKELIKDGFELIKKMRK